MAKSIDDLLNSIKQEYENKATDASAKPSSSEQPPHPSPPSPPQNTPTPHPKSVESLLADIGMGTPPPSSVPTSNQRPLFPTVRSSPPTPTPSPPPVTTQRPLFPTVRSSSPTPTPTPTLGRSPSAATNPILADVKAQYEAEQAEAERQRLQALEADRRRQRQREEQERQERLAAEERQRQWEVQRQRELEAEQERQRHAAEKQRVARLRRAQDWLKQLDPNSDEGFWFESFAINYPSKLDAALEYLDALDVTD